MPSPSFSFPPTALPANSAALRAEVRAFLAEQRAAGVYAPSPMGWAAYNRAFSLALGRRGWIGMTWPTRYGGHERSTLERYLVTEELLASGAPMRAHWAADRQIGPLLLEFGTDWQKETLLPQFAAGSTSLAIGLSEPDSGSDLAGIRTRGERVEGGWSVTGEKIWITIAHQADYMTVFARTSPQGENRRDGVTRFLVDMQSPGITVTRIRHMAGGSDISSVAFNEVMVPDRMVIGDVDKAWSQIGSELANERSSPDRWTACMGLLKLLIDRVGPHPDRVQAEALGHLVAQLHTLKSMSLSIAGMIERGEETVVEGSIVKDLGTHYDQEIPLLARRLIGEAAQAALPMDDPFLEHLRYDLLYSPAFTIRGGTREILRNAIARGLGIR